MTKILRQISPEIFDQIYSLANKQNTLSWQIILLGAVAVPLPAPPSEALCGSRSPELQCPCAGQDSSCWLLPAFWEKPVSPFVLCHVTQSSPGCCHFDKQEIHSQVGKKRWVLYREEMLWSLVKCFFLYLKESCTVLLLQILLYTLLSGKSVRFASWLEWILTCHWYLTENALSFLLWFPAWFAVFVSVGFQRKRHQNRRDKSPPRSVVEETPETQ